MDLHLDTTQVDFIAGVRRFARQRAEGNDPAAHVHGDYGPQTPVSELAELGLPGLTLPESADGSAAGLFDLCLALEELGRAGITTPLVSSTGLVGHLLAHDAAGEREQQILSELASGEAVAAAALLTPEAHSEWSSPPSAAKRAGDGWVVSAEFSQTPYAHLADWLVLVAELEGVGARLVALRVPDVPADQIAIRSQRVIGGAPRDHVTLTQVSIAETDVLALTEDQVEKRLDEALRNAALLQTAHTIGSCEGALDLAVTWAREREQFGRVIGSFQMVSHRCAEIRLAIDPARLLLWEAAWAVDTQRDSADELVSVAKGFLSQACADVATHAHQVMGAIGYSVEHAMHIHTRSIKAFQNAYGSSTRHLERVAQAIGL